MKKFGVASLLLVLLASCTNQQEEIAERQQELKAEMDSAQSHLRAIEGIQRQYTINVRTMERIDAEMSKSLSVEENNKRYEQTAKRIDAAADSARMLEPKKDSIRWKISVLKWQYDSLDRVLKRIK